MSRLAPATALANTLTGRAARMTSGWLGSLGLPPMVMLAGQSALIRVGFGRHIRSGHARKERGVLFSRQRRRLHVMVLRSRDERRITLCRPSDLQLGEDERQVVAVRLHPDLMELKSDLAGPAPGAGEPGTILAPGYRHCHRTSRTYPSRSLAVSKLTSRSSSERRQISGRTALATSTSTWPEANNHQGRCASSRCVTGSRNARCSEASSLVSGLDRTSHHANRFAPE